MAGHSAQRIPVKIVEIAIGLQVSLQGFVYRASHWMVWLVLHVKRVFSKGKEHVKGMAVNGDNRDTIPNRKAICGRMRFYHPAHGLALEVGDNGFGNLQFGINPG